MAKKISDNIDVLKYINDNGIDNNVLVNVIKSILPMSEKELEELGGDENAPILQRMIVASIASDVESGSINNLMKLLDVVATEPLKKNVGGRPEKYSSEFHPKLAKLFYSQGGIDREFAEYIGITEPTIHAWKKKYKEFREAIRSGKLDPDMKVESALYSSAVNDGSNTAQIFWLKNRRPERWRDKQEIDLKGELTTKNVFQVVDRYGNAVSTETKK